MYISRFKTGDSDSKQIEWTSFSSAFLRNSLIAIINHYAYIAYPSFLVLTCRNCILCSNSLFARYNVT